MNATVVPREPGRGALSIGVAPARLSLGELTVDIAAQQARWRGRPVPLRPNEFRLLVHFVENPDQVFSRTSLIAMLGKDCEAIDERNRADTCSNVTSPRMAGSAARAGLTWHFARPPVIDLEYEMDCRRVMREVVI